MVGAIKFSKTFAGVGVGLAATLFLMAGNVSAANQTNQGISISPFQQQLSIAPDDSSKSFELKLTNRTARLQELSLMPRDFGSLNDSGGVLLEGTPGYAQKYGLTSWLKLGTDTVVLQPGETQSIPITVENRASLQPGGHYGAVVATVNALDEQATNHVIVNQQLLSLIFVKKVGGEHYNLSLKDVRQNGNWLHLPNDVRLRFQNPGNVHVVPRGLVRLKSPTGKVVAQGIINSESAYILPETYRELYVPLTRIGSAAPLPGLYHLTVEYRYDGIAQTVSKSYAVHFISLGIYLLAALLIILLFVVLRRQKRLNKKPITTE